MIAIAQVGWREAREVCAMWLTMTLLLVALWILGMVSGAALGWWIHLLLIFALITLILSVVRTGRTA